jgi:hypothetical protein
LGNIPVMPADQNVCAVRPALDFIDQLRKLVVLEPTVNRETEFLGERFDGEARAMTVGGILGGEELVKFQRPSVNREIIEIINVCSGASFASGRQTVAIVRLFGVPDDQNDCIF